MRRLLPLAVAGCVLALLSAAVWQYRFANAGPALDVAFGPDFRGWTMKSGERITREGDFWVLPPPEDTAVSADAALPGLAGFRFLRVSFDAAWEGMERKDGRSWNTGRLTLGMRKPDGRYWWPADADLINGAGTRARHRVEWVMDLPPGNGEPHLVLVNLAARGVLKVADLQVTPVRQRGWVPAGTIALLAGWTLWFALLCGSSFARWRRAAVALFLVAGGWFLVFPQPQYHARPLPGGFQLGPEIPRPPRAPAAVPSPAPTVVPSPAPAVAAVAPVPPRPQPPPPSVEVAGRIDHPAAGVFRRIDRDLPLAHVIAFAALGLVAGTLAGCTPVWLAVGGMAVLSEVLPNLLRQDFQADDAVDLAANLAGLLIAAAVIAAATRIRRRVRARRIS